MVTINFTLVVELILFLVFLWLVSRLVVRPLLTTIDEREEKIAADRAAAKERRAEAQALSDQYDKALAEARRDMAQKVQRSRRDALSKRAATLQEERVRGDEEMKRIRQEARRLLNEQRPRCSELAPELADQIVEQLTSRVRA